MTRFSDSKQIRIVESQYKLHINETPYLAAAPGAGLLVSDLTLDGGRVQELQHLGAAQAVGRAAVLLVVAGTTDNLS